MGYRRLSLKPEDSSDVRLYKKRNLIERMFSNLKENKRTAVRFDKLDYTFLKFYCFIPC